MSDFVSRRFTALATGMYEILNSYCLKLFLRLLLPTGYTYWFNDLVHMNINLLFFNSYGRFECDIENVAIIRAKC